MDLPLIRPNPPRLSELQAELRAIEASGIYSNRGPVSRVFEEKAVEVLFEGEGACLAIANATLGLMLALREATRGPVAGRFALMPSFTFAAAAQASLWTGLTPLLCDIDPGDWSASARAEERLLVQYGSQVGVIVPYATFGCDIDLERYEWLARRFDVGVVVDAAASIGTRDAGGRGFGAGSRFALVFSMHATKSFATGEGGLIYCADRTRIETLASMANFGFEGSRSATLPGLNAKLSEVAALLALTKLGEVEAVSQHRALLTECYRAELAGFQFQRRRATRQAMQFMPILLPVEVAPCRAEVIAALAAQGIGAGTYFSPHLAEQPLFKESCRFGPLPVADEVGARALSLPITDGMTVGDVGFICRTLRGIVDDIAARSLPARMSA